APGRVKLSGTRSRRSPSADVNARRTLHASALPSELWAALRASHSSRCTVLRGAAVVTARRSRHPNVNAGSGTSARHSQKIGDSCAGARGAPRYRVRSARTDSTRAVSDEASVPGAIRTCVGVVDATSYRRASGLKKLY